MSQVPKPNETGFQCLATHDVSQACLIDAPLRRLLARLTGAKCGPNPRGVGMVNVPSGRSRRSSACTYDRSRMGTAHCAQSWVLLGEMACAVALAGATVDPA